MISVSNRFQSDTRGRFAAFTPVKTARVGFTLIELLVVIAIIAILAAILFPVFSQAREKARQTSCLSNVKQIALAMNMYAQDFDETYPPARYYGFGDAWTWDYYIQSYAQGAGSTNYGQGNSPYLVCPSDSVDRTTSTQGKRSYAVPMSAVSGSDLAWITEVYPSATSGFTAGRPLSDFQSPASSILIAELPTRRNRIGTNDEFRTAGPGPLPGNTTALFQARDTPRNKPLHSEGWNYGFADGHAKWFKPEQTVRTAGVTYPKTNRAGYRCAGTITGPCGMWTLSEDD